MIEIHIQPIANAYLKTNKQKENQDSEQGTKKNEHTGIPTIKRSFRVIWKQLILKAKSRTL